jgi:hypothetical protein
MLVLFETPAGYALFKAKDGKLKDEDMSALFKTPELASSMVKLSFGKSCSDVLFAG